MSVICINKYKNKYLYSENNFFISIVLLITFLIYRLDFYSLKTIPFLKYGDLLAIFAILNICGYVFQKKGKLEIDEEERFVFDIPITKTEEDRFYRKEIAETIANRIINTISDKSSFTIGIQSEWGYGKTSFLNLIVENIEKQKKDNIKIIHYNPWLSYEKDKLTQDFFDIIVSELKKQNSNLSNNISLYSKALANIEYNSIFSKAVSSIFNLSFPKPTINDLFKKINESIIDSKLQMIFIIDDIDRLNKEEVVEIIRLIRNVANFTNTTFVVAYDKSYVINALKESQIYNPEKYLEKIFQYEHVLSPVNQIEIKERMYSEILKIISKNQNKYSLTDSEKEENLKSFFDDSLIIGGVINKHFFWHLLNNLRDVTRYMNQFSISFQHLGSEVDLCDLLNLEIFRTKYPIVCTIFFKNKAEEYLLIQNKQRLVLRQTKILGVEIDIFVYEIKKQMESNPSRFGIVNEDIEDVVKILKALFPESTESILFKHSNGKSINDISRFTVYKNYVLPKYILPERDFLDAVNGELDKLCKSIDKWIQDYDINEIHKKFNYFDTFKTKAEYEKIIMAIFYFARKTYGESFNYDNNDLLKKMNYDYFSLSQIYKSKKELESFVLSVFKEAESPYIFDMQLLHHAHYHSVKFILDNEKINELRLEFLEKYLNENHPITRNTWYLYFWCDLKTDASDSTNKVIEDRNPKAKELIINYIKKEHIDDFILASFERWTNGEKKYAIFNSFVELFGTFEVFEKFLRKFNVNNSKYIKEYKMFLKEYKKVYPRGRIEFIFKIIPIDERDF